MNAFLLRLVRGCLRAVAVAIVRTVYRIRVAGLENLPEGGGLLVANHLSHVDALVLGAALAHRPVAFLMHRSFFAVPVVGAFSRLMGAMPVASEDSPEEKARSLARAAETARAGRLVCIFAEGGISRTGALLPFARGLETIARDARVPIVPVALDRLWGSLFSFSEGRFFWKRPRRVPYPVEIVIGNPMPFDSERWRVRGAVAELVALSREAAAPRLESLARRFLRSARRHARRTAVVDESGRRLTYRALLREALVARAVIRRTTAERARIGVRSAPSADAVVLHLGIALAGRIADEGDLTEPSSRATRKDRVVAWILSWVPGPLLARLLDPVPDGTHPAAAFRNRHGGDVLQSHAGIASSAQSLAQMFGFGPGRSVLGVLPLSSVLGSVSSLWVPLLSGGKTVLASPATARDICRRERPEVVVGTPALYEAGLAALEPEDLASVRLAFCGGDPLDPELAEAWKARFGTEISEGYGCAELCGVVSVNVPGIESGDARQQANRAGTVGRAIPGVAVKIVAPGTLEELPPEQPGRLLGRGPGRMLGQDGWFDTGDEAYLDRDAFLVITRPGAG